MIDRDGRENLGKEKKISEKQRERIPSPGFHYKGIINKENKQRKRTRSKDSEFPRLALSSRCTRLGRGNKPCRLKNRVLGQRGVFVFLI